jgi:hypothetical protein
MIFPRPARRKLPSLLGYNIATNLEPTIKFYEDSPPPSSIVYMAVDSSVVTPYDDEDSSIQYSLIKVRAIRMHFEITFYSSGHSITKLVQHQWMTLAIVFYQIVFKYGSNVAGISGLVLCFRFIIWIYNATVAIDVCRWEYD